MSDDEKPLVFPLFGDQRAAVEPADTVWLGASAGTGKTQVLSARVLRLLLQPHVRPEQLLCLTFTKAGAAEMATRVNEVLASWVRLEDTKLAAQLEHIGADIGEETRTRARSRFAAVLDCPGGGLRIGTIHSFAQWLLAAFPLEAGMLPGTRAMEDRDKDLLVRQVLADVLVEAEAAGDAVLLDALTALSLRLTSDQVQGWLLRCAAAREMWHGPGAWQPPLRPRIARVLGLGDDPRAALLDLCGDGGFDCAALRRCVAAQSAWGTKTGLATSDTVVGWLIAPPEVRLERLDELHKALFTGDGNPRSLGAMLKHDASYEDAIERVRSSIGRAMELRGLIALADYIEPALLLGRTFALAWEEAKQREGFIDFDDQIRHAAALLERSEMADWVRFKLDRQFDHILVDEAQDTNQAQWRIIDALIGDFFSGEGQRGEVLRTLFVVGDYKQAIFRFQGTSPENFEAARRRVRTAMLGVKRELQDLGLDRSFRTAQPVLEFVDAAINAIGPRRFGLEHAPDPHIGEDRPGLVTLWPVIGTEGDNGEARPEGEEGWLSRPDRQLAERIARQVRQWLVDGFPLAKGGARLAGAGDVMVLVRKRKELAGLIVARLHAAGVPVAGVDRLRLGAPLGVKDLVAALRFAAQPRDDLNLANLLVSPLIGWSQEDLLEHAYREKGVGLWAHLRRMAAPGTLVAREQLLELLRRADFETPQALLHWLLVGPWQGRRKLVARLGREVEDPVNELLNAAFAYASGETASLVGFLQWFDANTSELKREAGRSDGQVRVMTVHGAKGLQAPIVILADAADDPDASPPRGLTLPEPVPGSEARQVPLPPLRKAEKVGAVLMAEERAALEERAEHWRLLYVAMTRAEEALFIAGTQGGRSKELAPDSWYARLSPLFNDAEPLDDPLWGGRHEIGSRPPSAARISLPESPAEPLPDWALRPVGAEPRPPRPLAPSSSGEETAPDAPSAPSPELRVAAERGVLIHRLLERLPDLPEAQRADAAMRWLGQSARQLSAGDRDEIAQAALTVLADSQWASVFGPDSLPEVPIAATVGERVVAGSIDRLVVGAEAIRIVDFKTARRPPADLSEVPIGYIRQMAAYAAALRAIHPAQRIEAALLYTHAPLLIPIPQALLEAHNPASAEQQ
ncbi:double-strand break repair helicase AddA [Novosphingobium sp. Gsoil 351]|uniref:double-strand break repair helicase AddA n=1 Tax=Novosphingobium sp. Gsoil 351 TaxID=2675225 RepID=UPI0012B4D39A|nr:double-strand break repair helicase AddA [Novosphingobium sp. Gsoil 351]QGN53738.1 double-strand break repair helicase AddA [Novosphingobium sp. Gsoil 351]